MEKAQINKDLCIMCGVCVSVNPDVFYFADDGTIGVKEGDGSTGIASCPTGAIAQ